MLLVSSATSDASCGIGAPRQHQHRCQPKGDNGVTEVYATEKQKVSCLIKSPANGKCWNISRVQKEIERKKTTREQTENLTRSKSLKLALEQQFCHDPVCDSVFMF